jgi:hypothetical protein
MERWREHPGGGLKMKIIEIMDNEFTFTPKEEFDILIKEITFEQEFYWTRFTGFATLHAGLFVLFTSETNKHPIYLSAAALAMGAIWLYVQIASCWYVNRLKRRFRRISEGLKFKYPRHEIFSCKYMDITRVTIVIPVTITLLWLALLFGGVLNLESFSPILVIFSKIGS